MMGRIMFDVRCSICRSFEARDRVFEFDYEKLNKFKFVQCSKNDVLVCLISSLVNLVRALLGLLFVCSKQK